ncbi:hypothetical protein BURPS305_6011 [Burkholderia pseudomallei 305]|nr:hypothetical protein BURPS305_6011 [Burkholderia pseudomallei 305]EDO89436.1 hypothetical protein BURPSPAST_AC0452 [Burkholderia pseudomallei Pasteur 52237]EDU12431.1 hypothetical protein BURPS1655_D1325 [Burkholderia pseudomallei 1655]
MTRGSRTEPTHGARRPTRCVETARKRDGGANRTPPQPT